MVHPTATRTPFKLRQASRNVIYCKPALWLIILPTCDLDSFTEAIFCAEGLDWPFVNRRLREQVRAVIRDEFASAS